MNRTFFFFLSITLFFYGCNSSIEQENTKQEQVLKSVELNYAQGFEIQQAEDYKIITLKNVWKGETTPHQYVLYKNNKPEGFDNAIFVKIPIKSIVCFSLTHVAFIDRLDELNSIKALSGSDYVSNQKVLDKIQTQQIKEIGSEQLVNYELLVELHPDLVMTFGIDETSKTKLNKLESLGQKVVLNSEYMENHPLGKAEWIKFVGAFYDKDSLANAIYNNIESEYHQLVELTQRIEAKPSVFVGMPWNGAWYLAGGKSFQAQLFKDAGANYLWAENTETSSFVVDKEVIFEKAFDADYWINLNAFNSITEVLTVHSKFAAFKSVKNKQVFNNNLKVNKASGNDYWESGVINPHVVLADLIQIFHPNLIEHELVYYKQLE